MTSHYDNGTGLCATCNHPYPHQWDALNDVEWFAHAYLQQLAKERKR